MFKVFKLSIAAFYEPRQKVLKAFCFDPIISCRADHIFEFFRGHVVQAVRIKGFGTLYIVNGLFDIGPIGVLRQDGAHRDFKGTVTRPPVLWSILF